MHADTYLSLKVSGTLSTYCTTAATHQLSQFPVAYSSNPASLFMACAHVACVAPGSRLSTQQSASNLLSVLASFGSYNQEYDYERVLPGSPPSAVGSWVPTQQQKPIPHKRHGQCLN
eukprot:343081-Pelagomonas_calceolata.AAC.5